MLRAILSAALFAVLAAPAQAAPVLQEIRIPMRDGVEIALDVYTPAGMAAGANLPVIVSFTPYHVLYKPLGPDLSEGYRFTEQGYAFVLADVRGTYESGGCWDYGGLKERQDGYDLVEWLGTQAWSNGKVAMIGNSYDGTTATAAAVENPPHLAAIVPISGISRWYGYAYTQGVRHAYSGGDADSDPPSDTPLDFQFGYGFLPPPEPGSITSAEQVAMRWNLCDRATQIEHGYDMQPDFDDFWRDRDYLRVADRIKAAALISHGLQDYNVKTWEGTQLYEAIRGPKMMIVGQWAHASPSWPDWPDLLDRFFARWLLGEATGIEAEPPLIVQGIDGEFTRRNRWAGTGRVTAKLGTEDADFLDDGALTESEMLQGQAGTRAVRIQLPGLGGVHIEGRPILRLRATSDQASTHFVALLLDVAPGGTKKIISRAFMNARYRKGLETGSDLEPGKPDTFALELIDKDHAIPADHEVELFVASSSTSWVLSDERRAANTLHLAESTLEIPIPGDDPVPPPVTGHVVPPGGSGASPGPAGRARRCATRATLRLPRGRWRVRATVNGRRAKATRRGRKVIVRLPRTRTGRAIIRVTARRPGRRVVRTRRVRTCLR